MSLVIKMFASGLGLLGLADIELSQLYYINTV